MAEMLTGSFDAVRGCDQRAAFLAQGMNRLLLPHTFVAEPCVEATPGAIAPVVVVCRGRIGFSSGQNELGLVSFFECAKYVDGLRREVDHPLTLLCFRLKVSGAPNMNLALLEIDLIPREQVSLFAPQSRPETQKESQELLRLLGSQFAGSARQ